jgi:uncharacterized protein (DUF1778 family)
MVENNAMFPVKENKSTSITLKLTPRQKAWVISAAEKCDMNVSQYILHLVSLSEFIEKRAERMEKQAFFDDEE